MGICHYHDRDWTSPELVPLEPLALHPASHVLHYASTCFEGLKAYRWDDGSVHIFRLDKHIQRMRASAGFLYLPVPGPELLHTIICQTVAAARNEIPEFPGALYLRPALIGTEPNIGAAAKASAEATLFVLASPVGDYFEGGQRPDPEMSVAALDALHLGPQVEDAHGQVGQLLTALVKVSYKPDLLGV